MTKPAEIQAQWSAIDKMVDHINRPEARLWTDEQLGAAFRSYVVESRHQGWDGFAQSDMTGIRRFLFDMSIYVTACRRHDPPV